MQNLEQKEIIKILYDCKKGDCLEGTGEWEGERKERWK
jgi:hypothetical protein